MGFNCLNRISIVKSVITMVFHFLRTSFPTSLINELIIFFTVHEVGSVFRDGGAGGLQGL